jgi:putative endonuclease
VPTEQVDAANTSGSAAREDHRRALGRRGETLAAEHLIRLGFTIVARNARTRHGEIDLIAFDGHTLAFVEVKSRRARGPRMAQVDPELAPLASLRRRQRARLRGLAAAWLSEQRPAGLLAQEIRFDAIGVTIDARGELLCLEHLQAAW